MKRPASSVSSPRSKIWELAESIHCSVIGTCLSNAEARHVLVRLDAARRRRGPMSTSCMSCWLEGPKLARAKRSPRSSRI
jgi:hypothetical protein